MSSVELTVTDAWRRKEWVKCSRRPWYFVDEYVQIYDANDKMWVPFRLRWESRERNAAGEPARVSTAQFHVLKMILLNLLMVILKARQLGQTWLVLAFALWMMLFRPAATILLFSKRDDEAVYLLDERLKGIYNRLPLFLQAKKVTKSDAHTFGLSNGSIARAFPTTAGDSYTASMAIVDEADLVPDLGRLMRAVKPTIDNGGRMILLSRADKSRPQSEFKRIYRGAKAKLTKWVSVFLPWHVHPDRDEAWYAEQRDDILHRTGSLDDLHEQYPATDEEAMAARTLDKRIAPGWLSQCYAEGQPIAAAGAPAIPGLMVYRVPEAGRHYCIGLDPAEGNPTSDDSALTVGDVASGEEVAKLAGKFEPSVIAGHGAKLAEWYNLAGILVERNNHGHATILWLRDNAPNVRLILGYDDQPGWLSNSKGKTMLYDDGADVFRDGDTTIHSASTFYQLSSIEGSSLRAPKGEFDDEATAYVLMLKARTQGVVAGQLFF